MNFIDELLAESEVKEQQHLLQMNKLKADQILAALAVLEKQSDEVNKLANDELQIIEDYRATELEKIAKKAVWLEHNLEEFIRSTDEKTINLPHGSLKLRLGRDKLEITDLSAYLPFAKRKGLLRHVEASDQPDMLMLYNYFKLNNSIPAGVIVIPATAKFSYTTLKCNGDGKQTISPEPES